MSSEALNAVKISVIIPIYKVEHYLRQCLDSVVNQTYRNLEIILVDDGSPDNCGIICDEYALNDRRVVVIHKENGGLSAARNDGIDRATGDWITFVDSDDWLDLDYYEQFVKAIGNSRPDIFQACEYISEYPEKSIRRCTFRHAFQASGKENVEELMLDILNIGLPWDKLYRADFLKENSLRFDITIKAFEDHLFNFQVFYRAKSVSGAVFAGYHYRQEPMSISKGYNPDKPKINYDFITKLHGFIDREQLPIRFHVATEVDAILAMQVTMDCCYFHLGNKKTYHEVAKEIREMKEWPYYHDAICSSNNHYFQPKQQIIKYVLRCPWVWPVKLFYDLDRYRTRNRF